jgi:hypothetical protein
MRAKISLPRFLIEALGIYSKVQHRSAYIRQQFAQNLQFFRIGRLYQGRVKHKPISFSPNFVFGQHTRSASASP